MIMPIRLLLLFSVLLFFSLQNIVAYQDEEIIDIRGFNYGRLQIAINVENNLEQGREQLKQTTELLKKHLLWSGLFDIKEIFEDVDLLLKLRFVPNQELRVWIYTPDNTTLFDYRSAIKGPDQVQIASIKMVEEIILQLTGERSILRSAIAYIEKDSANRYRLKLTDAFGEQYKTLVDDGKYNILPRFKPDASAILFTTLGQRGSHLRQITLKTSEVQTLFKNLSKLSGGSWTDTGEELIITKSLEGNSDLFKVDMKGNVVEQMTFRNSTEANPRLSPDGKRLVFVSNRSGSVQIYQRILDSGEMFRMTFEGSYNYEPNWSNDGAYIVFSGLKDSRYQIFLMDKEGDFVQQITRGNISCEQPVWSPNGRQILFVSKVGYDQKLFIVRADGTFQRRLTKTGNGISEFNPTWTAKHIWTQFTQ